jgi:hypothetical protein
MIQYIILFDINQQQLEPWNNTAFSVIALIQLPSATAGSQTNML